MQQTTQQRQGKVPIPPVQPPFHSRMQLLSSYTPIEKQAEARKEDVRNIRETKALSKITGAFEEFLCDCNIRQFFIGEGRPQLFVPEMVQVAKQNTRSIGHTAADITAFSFMLEDFQFRKNFDMAGIFLSALTNSAKGRECTIFTCNLSIPIKDLGFENLKLLTIIGDVGHSVGWKMRSGRITVTGNAGSGAGDCMEGGELRINGETEGIGHGIKGGSIFVHGKQIVKDGVRLE